MNETEIKQLVTRQREYWRGLFEASGVELSQRGMNPLFPGERTKVTFHVSDFAAC